MKTGVKIALGTVLGFGALVGSYLLFFKKKTNNSTQNLNTQKSSANNVQAKPICNYDLMNNGSCDLKDKSYIDFMVKTFPSIPNTRDRYRMLAAGLGISDNNIVNGLAKTYIGDKWLIVQAKDKVKKGLRNDYINAKIGISLWHQRYKLFNLSKKQYEIMSWRLNEVDKQM